MLCAAVDSAFLSMLASAELSEEFQMPAPKYIEVTGGIAELAVTILGRQPKDLAGDDGISLSAGDQNIPSSSLCHIHVPQLPSSKSRKPHKLMGPMYRYTMLFCMTHQGA